MLLLVALLSVMSLAVPMAPAHAANTDPAAYLVGHRWPTGHPSASGPAVGYPMKHQVTPPPEVAVWRPARLIAPVTGKPDTAAVYASDPPAADGGDIPPWVLAVGVIAAVGAAAIWAVRRRP
ncbi:hypothetical protein MB901379_04845 [Mycobacterium basiliense]|uniref:Uncharacterized protein n=1 Tax=Mycobacterium basiliense TaxID=2094119 RepID=A0A447GL47_9MYCO|nr:hypothetical protein MB901379_04845 [Mycobacterium basiliense]